MPGGDPANEAVTSDQSQARVRLITVRGLLSLLVPPNIYQRTQYLGQTQYISTKTVSELGARC